jgi:hypothetical protein
MFYTIIHVIAKLAISETIAYCGRCIIGRLSSARTSQCCQRCTHISVTLRLEVSSKPHRCPSERARRHKGKGDRITKA